MGVWVILSPVCPCPFTTSNHKPETFIKSVPRSASASVKLRGLLRLTALASVMLLSAQLIEAQQPATGRKRVPRLTTDDVVRLNGERVSEPGADGKPPEAGTSGAPGSKVSAEESAWRERVKEARRAAKSLERSADEVELRMTELRNELSASGQTSRQRNETAAQLDEAGRRLTEMRAQARKAAAELEDLINLGRQKGYSEEAEAQPTTGDGSPNEQYYRARYAALLEEMSDAERLIRLYENRVRDLNQRILLNSGSGDNFYTAQIQQDRDAMQERLNEAREAREKARSSIDALVEEARRAGLPPGVFR
jgi:chromosome segregation ATPase